MRWAGVGIADAFRPQLDHQRRRPALKLFFALCQQAQQQVARLACGENAPVAHGQVSPQLAPCHTDHPPGPAAHAAIGLTALLEYNARTGGPEHLSGPATRWLTENGGRKDVYEVEPIVRIAAEVVEARLVLSLLRSTTAGTALEHHRLFVAAQQTGTLGTMAEVVQAAVLLGNLVPWRDMPVHPDARRLLSTLLDVSGPYEWAFSESTDPYLDNLAVEWTLVLANVLMSFAKAEQAKEQSKGPTPTGAAPAGAAPTDAVDMLAPLDGMTPPRAPGGDAEPDEYPALRLWDALDRACASLDPASPTHTASMEAIRKCATALAAAAAPASVWEAPRPDLVAATLLARPFSATSIQGTPMEGHEVEIPQAGGQPVAGELFDRALELSDDLPALDDLVREAAPLTKALRRALYPTTSEIPVEDRYRTSGGIDARRISLADVSDAVFRRYRSQVVPDRRGRSVLLIACDGSASLSSEQVRMTKLLCAGWMQATLRSDVDLLAAFYRGDESPAGGHAPLVEWIYHPDKTPAVTRAEALRVLPSVPDEGRGAQSDALSLTFLLGEAKAIARGRKVYLVIVSDCSWNHTSDGQSGIEEMQRFLEITRAGEGDDLHVTLVALAARPNTTLDERMDKVIEVSDADLGDPGAVAMRVSDYVATCMRERRQTLARA